MEKSTVKQERRRHSGLLMCIFLTVFIFPAEAKRLSDSEIPSLKLIPRDDICFVGQEMTYTLELPGVDSSLARTDVPDFSDGKTDARFISARKTEFSDSEGEAGTRFQFQIVFSSAGRAVLPPLTVYINRHSYAIPFEQVTVYEDPATIQPQLSISFEDDRLQSLQSRSAPLSVSAGETITFTLSIRYCTQILHFSWDLPKNSIFTELTRYDSARGEPQKKSFSPEPLPLARFSWTPLVEASYTLPTFSVEAVAYNGGRKMISLPPQIISVSAAQETREKAVLSSPSQSLFDQAFAPPEQTDEKSALTADATVAKSQAGKVLKVIPSDSQRPVLFLAGAVASALLSGALCLLRQKRKMLLPLMLSLACLGGAVWTFAGSRTQYALFSGGAVYAVPEDSASSVMQLPADTRVRIVEKAGDWVYIKSDDYAGWVKEKEE